MERFAPAKLNLTLDVLGKRPDGYHDLKMVMQSITLGDTLTLEPGGEGVRVQTDLHFLPTGPKNLAAAAALRFYETLGRPVPGLEISIRKRIPVCAGMAGGSTDAAAVLRALNEKEGNPFSMEELARVGKGWAPTSLTAYWAAPPWPRGGGDADPTAPAAPVLGGCVQAGFPRLHARAVCTHRRDAGPLPARHRRTAGSAGGGDLPGVARRMYNVFEKVLPERQEVRVAEIKHTLIQCGAPGRHHERDGPHRLWPVPTEGAGRGGLCPSVRAEPGYIFGGNGLRRKDTVHTLRRIPLGKYERYGWCCIWTEK